MCKLAVQQDGLALRRVRKNLQNEEICKLAVLQDANALEYVRKDLQTEEIRKLADIHYNMSERIYKQKFIK